MTPDRLETLALRVRTVAENNPAHVGLSAWEPSRPYLFGENSKFNIRPVHGPEKLVWRVEDAAGFPLRDEFTFAAAVEGLL